MFETYKHHNQPNVISRNLSLLGNDGYLGLVAASNRFDRFLELRQVRVLDLLLLFPGILHCRSPGGGLSIREDLTISEQCPEGGKRDGEGEGGQTSDRIAFSFCFIFWNFSRRCWRADSRWFEMVRERGAQVDACID